MSIEHGATESITVFAASSLQDYPAAVDAVDTVVDSCARHGMSITFGGAGVGLMGAVATRAHQKGVPTIGVIPQFLVDREPPSPLCTTLVRVETMADRKRQLLDTRGLCVLPGGFGTLDETFEAITLKQLGLLDIPIALINVDGYYDHVLDFVAACERRGSIVVQGRDTFRVFTDPNAAIDYLCT